LTRTTPLRIIMEWKSYVRVVIEAVRRVVPEAETYLVGGAAEGRLTVASDVDVLVVLPRRPSVDEAVEVRTKIIEEAEKLGLPPHAPVELHVIGKDELRRYARGSVIPLHP